MACLETLPPVSYRDAFAEVVKYGVAMDRGIFELLQKERERLLARDRRALERVVFRCVTAKALVVARDERERGPRAILNYGHTAGHALEAASRFRVSHGRAVAFGMRVAAKIALSLELCGPRLVEAQDELLTEHDKKARRGRVAWVMPRRLGHAEPGHVVPAGVVRRFVRKALA
jgi:3-dehydroquinate synthase